MLGASLHHKISFKTFGWLFHTCNANVDLHWCARKHCSLFNVTLAWLVMFACFFCQWCFEDLLIFPEKDANANKTLSSFSAWIEHRIKFQNRRSWKYGIFHIKSWSKCYNLKYLFHYVCRHEILCIRFSDLSLTFQTQKSF